MKYPTVFQGYSLLWPKIPPYYPLCLKGVFLHQLHKPPSPEGHMGTLPWCKPNFGKVSQSQPKNARAILLGGTLGFEDPATC